MRHNQPPTHTKKGAGSRVVPQEPHSGREHTQQTTSTKNVVVSHRPLVPVSSTHCCASTSGLSTQSSTGGLTHLKGARISHLEAGFPLRCFQRLSLPDVANQPCPWQNNWHTRGQSIPVLSYWGRPFSNFLRAQRIGTELSHDVLNPARVPL